MARRRGILMRCSSDFECGNGANFVETAPRHWRMNVRADRPGYDHFFHFRVEAEENDDGPFQIEILPAPELDHLGGAARTPWAFAPHVLWRKLRPEGAWERMSPDAFAVTPEKIVIRQLMRAGDVRYFAEACPLSYSSLTRHMQELAASRPCVATLNLGETTAQRALVGVRVTDANVPAAEKSGVFILAGQHGTEFAGMFAAQGALDFLVSRLPQAAALRRRYVFDILPCANPDGNAHGLGCSNTEGRDQLEAFENIADALAPPSAAAQHIWRHLTENVPGLIINFHGYAHPRPFGDPPYEGIYVPDAQRLSDPDRRRMQEVINHALFYLTNGGSQHRRPCPQLPNTLEEAAATTWNTLSALYQVQTAEGPHRNVLTGVHVLRTLLGTIEQAQNERMGLG